jgi:hypothetical protein
MKVKKILPGYHSTLGKTIKKVKSYDNLWVAYLATHFTDETVLITSSYIYGSHTRVVTTLPDAESSYRLGLTTKKEYKEALEKESVFNGLKIGKG